MRIGLDIDNVINDFDKRILEEFLVEDKKKRNKGIINPKATHIIEGMFDWSKEEIDEFFALNMERISETIELRKNAKYYMDKLLKEGHELYLLTHRVYPHYNHPLEVTEKWLKNNDLSYTKLVITKSTDKSPECRELKLDIMFDDSVRNCKYLRDAGINYFLVKTNYNHTRRENLKFVTNWDDIYDEIMKLAVQKLPKVHVILDTDANNEADDQFALAYLLKSKDRIILDAVTIAPYSIEYHTSIKENTDLSYQVCHTVFNLCEEDSTNMIFKGSTDYFKNGYLEKTPAIRRMVEVINQNDLTYILGIGAITNIAVLLKLYPELKNKIKVIWLGGHSIMNRDNRELNFRQDVEAVSYVFNSKLDLTVMPCYGVSSNLTTSIYELKHFFSTDDGLGKYLCDRFYNDGFHGITPRRVLWDISVISYIINPYWFDTKMVKNIGINKEMQYIENKEENEITFVTQIHQNKIFDDLFHKLGDKKEAL